MLKRTSACFALILGASYAFAQDASGPVASGTTSGGGSSDAAASGTTQVNIFTATPESTADISESFSLPGGYGNAPLNFTPGQGHFDRPALEFNTTVQQSYDDNIYSSSGAPGLKPVKGSMMTNLSEGVSVLLSQGRTGFTLDANVGGQYVWDRDGDKLTPSFGLDMIYAYRISPRTQLSVQLGLVYQTQSSYNSLNGLTDSNGKPYLTGNAKVDLLYRWTPLISLDTTYVAYGTYYTDSDYQDSNHLNQIIGESIRYSWSRNVTAILEGRVGQDTYDHSGSNSQSYYALTGADLTLSRRLSSAIRLGSQTRVNDGGTANTMPYAEATANYILTRTTLLGWNLRYGYNDTNSSTGAAKSLRTGINLNQSVTSRLRANLSVNIENADALQGDNDVTVSNSYFSIIGTAGVSYAFTKDLSVFANYNRIEKESPSDYVQYSKNVYSIGATYQY
ncbi:MAG: hypothetical protein ACFUZC_23160 [Chthoniobacteraceae bacterium]